MHGNVAGDHHRERAGDYTRAQSCPILLIVSPMYDTTVNLREQSASVHQLRRLLDAESADDCRGREREDIQTLSSPLRSTPIPRGLHSVPLQIHSSPSSTFLPSRGVFCLCLGKVPSKHETYVQPTYSHVHCSQLLALRQGLYHEHVPQERGDVRYALLELRLW